jgi:hypothetical protein
MAESKVDYAAKVTIDYPDRSLNRTTSFFRIFMMIPIAIILGLLSSHGIPSKNWVTGAAGAGVLFIPTLLIVLFRQKYPKWWFDFNLAITKLGARVGTYVALMTDAYPSTDEEQSVHLEINYPDVKKDLNRWLPLVKWFLAIPHYIVLFFIGIAAFVCIIVAWFAILFTGRYPRGIFDFVQGVYRWGLRVTAYAFILVTDKYPPFSLD